MRLAMVQACLNFYSHHSHPHIPTRRSFLAATTQVIHCTTAQPKRLLRKKKQGELRTFQSLRTVDVCLIPLRFLSALRSLVPAEVTHPAEALFAVGIHCATAAAAAAMCSCAQLGNIVHGRTAASSAACLRWRQQSAGCALRSWSSEERGRPGGTRMCSAAAQCRPAAHPPTPSTPTESTPAYYGERIMPPSRSSSTDQYTIGLPESACIAGFQTLLKG